MSGLHRTTPFPRPSDGLVDGGRAQERPSVHTASSTGSNSSGESDGAHAGDPNAQGGLAIATGVAVAGLGNFKSWILDRGRLVVAAGQEMRGGNARMAPLGISAAIGLPLVGHGLLQAKRTIDKEGALGLVTSGQGAMAVGEVAAGGGVLAFGLNKGLPNGLSLFADLFRGPTTNSIKIEGGLWGVTNKLSNGIGSSLGVLTLIAAGAGIQNGWSKDGPAGIYGTRSGRSGVIYGSGALIGLGFGLTAATKFRGPTQGFMTAYVGSEWLARPAIRNIKYGIGLAMGGLWLGNQFGWLDGLNVDAKPTL